MELVQDTDDHFFLLLPEMNFNAIRMEEMRTKNKTTSACVSMGYSQKSGLACGLKSCLNNQHYDYGGMAGRKKVRHQ